MPPRIVVVPPTHADIAEMAKKMAPSGFELVVSRADRAALEQVLPTAEYLVCYPNVRLDDALYKVAPRLKLYQLLSAGYDDVDLEAARRARVPVCNNGGANAISVSEHAIMLMLAVSRRVIWQHGNVSAGRWRGNGPAPVMYELFDKTLGIVGLGTIGKKVARIARALGMRIQYYDIARLPEHEEDAHGVRFRLLRELLASSDIVTMHVPLNNSTRHMIGANELALMKPDGSDRQHQPRPGDRRGGADQSARRPQDLRRRPRRVRPGAAAAGQSAVQARQRAADVAFRRADLGQSHGALSQRVRQHSARRARREAAVGGAGAGRACKEGGQRRRRRRAHVFSLDASTWARRFAALPTYVSISSTSKSVMRAAAQTLLYQRGR